MIEYKPTFRKMPERTVDVPTAWKEVAEVLEDILDHFHVIRGTAIEFGVDYGYSSSCLANYFEHVIAVDHFQGDVHAGTREEGVYEHVRDTLREFKNIDLVPLKYQDFISDCDAHVDFIHVDIVHTYAETFECGQWAIQHAPVVIFHDTLAFKEVMEAVTDLAGAYGMSFYNVPEQHGVGILVREP
jgi:hypothetical protein